MAAAYAAVVSLMNDLDLISIHPTHSFSFDHKQISSLSQTVHFLSDFMDTYDSHGKAAQFLESRIARAAHAAHDVIESHIVDQIIAGTTLLPKSRSFFLLDLQRAIDGMEFVKRKAILFKSKSGMKRADLDLVTYSASEPLTSGKNLMVGFDAVVVRLMELLVGEPSGQRVIPIVGMGGIGKTTLAINVYEHVLIRPHFDVRLWATISQKYNVKNILKELLNEDDSVDVCELGERLHKKLWRRRYLIVLDDMWDVEAWNEIMRFLPDNENGSRVIVTTRLSDMAAHLSSSLFEMDFLDDDKSWELFCGITFGEDGDCPVELEEIGKKIVERCRGLPLSIVVIGGHFKRSSRAIEYWEMVANLINPISGLGADDQCLKIISLSYEYLPTCLKPCFLYLGIFHEDARIDASELMGFWIVEGFLKGHADMCLEEVAEKYMKYLIDRNLILVRQRMWNGKVEYFVIHDIVRELCLKVAEKEKFLHVFDIREGVSDGREHRIVVPKDLSSLQLPSLQLPSMLRSLICHSVWYMDEFSVDLKLLRLSAYFNVVFFSNSDRYNILSSTTRFPRVNLRYHSNYTDHGDLSSSMSLLWNMQILRVNNIRLHSTICVPYEIWEMTELRHLEFVVPQFLLDPLPNVEQYMVLKNLHTLIRVSNLRLTEEVCKRMTNIKKLHLCYFEGFGDFKRSSSYYCLHNLGRLHKLESLVCEFYDSCNWRDVSLSISLPGSLEELSLLNCHWEDLTEIIKSAPRLGCLELRHIRGPEWDLGDEEFPCLKVLKIFMCDDLVNWNANDSHFPVLEILNISRAPKLSEIPFDIGEIPTLRHIRLYQCSVVVVISAMRIVVEQESYGNEDILIEVDFQKMEQVERFQTMMQEECLATNNLRLSCRRNNISAF